MRLVFGCSRIAACSSRLNELFESVGADTFSNDETNSNFESFLEDGIAELLVYACMLCVHIVPSAHIFLFFGFILG